MKAVDIIRKKISKKNLTKDEIDFFISNFMLGEIKDYQMTALVTAIFINGLNEKEITNLTLALFESGKKLDLSSIDGVKVDKHSTGGVGDKMSLIIGPLAASLGLKMAKMSGKGLGFTGGTIDKLESIKGFKVNLNEDKFIEQVKEINFALISQSKTLAPADKKLYDLRNDTGTVNSIPLIASSIMSKKFAAGSDIILLDVKCGSGAFIKNLEKARELSNLMVKIGKLANKEVRVEITDMDEPLGYMIGNKNEVLEAKKFLNLENVPKDLKELAYSSVKTLLLAANIAGSESEAELLIDSALNSRSALNKFYHFIEAQGGDTKKLKENKKFWKPKHKYQIKAELSGFLEITNAEIFGIISNDLGAGRYFKEDKIDYEAGIELHFKTNDFVEKNDVLFTLYSSKKINKNLEMTLSKAYKINNEKIKKNKLIIERIW